MRGDREPDVVSGYLRRITEVPLLTAAQEVWLAKRIEAGVYAAELLHEPGEPPAPRAELAAVARDGERARAHMIRANLRLVVSLAREWAGRGLAMADLIQEGNLGLIHAVEKFDYAKGYRFSTYATWWIRQAIRRGIAAQARMIRLPVRAEETLSILDRLAEGIAAGQGRDATPAELAGLAGLPATRVTELLRYRSGPVSLDTPVGDGMGTTLGDLIEDRTASRAFEAIEQRTAADELHARIDRLPRREADAIRMRFGLLDGEPWTLRAIAEQLELSPEGARQLVRKGLARLRRAELPGLAA